MRPAENRKPPSFRKRVFLAAAMLSAAIAARAEEDPLLGNIKGIQCVGCTAGSVDLIIHDPIDVRDFQVRIAESDYQKIITPLPGKTIYDKNGCFYWFDAPKGQVSAKADAAKKKAAGKQDKDDAKKAAPDDSSHSDSGSPAPPPSPEIQGTPSRCIPYTRVEPAPSQSGKQKD
ncbi:MAG: hypothetical protein JF616_13515 [Fibrobacteres bacterium]|nr:hypothetical protein [Fibrobacterota bacterium]